jgi:hypothetical protein
MGVSVLGAMLVVTVAALYVLLGGFGTYTRSLAIVYVIGVHLTLVWMGAIGLARAIKGHHYSFPVLGRFFRQ